MKTFSAILATLILVMAPLMVSAAEEATAVELVNKAFALWQEKGKDYSLKVINASAGPLRKDHLYTFSCDFSGLVLAHPAKTSLRGKNLFDLKDSKGNFPTQAMIKIAQSPEGTGWVEYQWDRGNNSGEGTKRTLVKRIPGENVFVACGYFVE